MGQYHNTYNVDKKEFMMGLGSSAKLIEQLGYHGSTSEALFLLVANSNDRGGVGKHPLIGSWAGDRIVVQGDYSEPTDKGYVGGDLAGWKDITGAATEMLRYVWESRGIRLAQDIEEEEMENWKDDEAFRASGHSVNDLGADFAVADGRGTVEKGKLYEEGHLGEDVNEWKGGTL